MKREEIERGMKALQGDLQGLYHQATQEKEKSQFLELTIAQLETRLKQVPEPTPPSIQEEEQLRLDIEQWQVRYNHLESQVWESQQETKKCQEEWEARYLNDSLKKFLLESLSIDSMIFMFMKWIHWAPQFI